MKFSNDDDVTLASLRTVAARLADTWSAQTNDIPIDSRIIALRTPVGTLSMASEEWDRAIAAIQTIQSDLFADKIKTQIEDQGRQPKTSNAFNPSKHL